MSSTTLTVERWGVAWAIFENGQRITGEIEGYHLADARRLKIEAQRARKAQSKRRPCITCETPFLSEGPHNRMCASCRASAAGLGAEMTSLATMPKRHA